MSPKLQIRIGWVLSALFALFMIGASVTPKLADMAVADATMLTLGWTGSPILLIGVLELACTLLFLYPPTAVLGGILMMAIFGGAITTQLRAGSPLASHTLFAICLGIWMWVALWLRDPRFRAVFPILR